jgi:hypothetical protein
LSQQKDYEIKQQEILFNNTGCCPLAPTEKPLKFCCRCIIWTRLPTLFCSPQKAFVVVKGIVKEKYSMDYFEYALKNIKD